MHSDGTYVVLFSYGLCTRIVFIIFSSHPDVVVDICSILLQVYPILLRSLRHLFCISVASWTVTCCVLLWTKRFSVTLKPKGVLFSLLVFCSHFLLYTDWKYPLFIAFNSVLIAGMFIYFFQHDTWLSVLVVCLWKPHKPEWYWEEICGWNLWCLFYCCLLFFLLLSSFSLFVLTERCGMCNTAYCNLCRPRIVALYFLSMGFVSV